MIFFKILTKILHSLLYRAMCMTTRRKIQKYNLLVWICVIIWLLEVNLYSKAQNYILKGLLNAGIYQTEDNDDDFLVNLKLNSPAIFRQHRRLTICMELVELTNSEYQIVSIRWQDPNNNTDTEARCLV